MNNVFPVGFEIQYTFVLKGSIVNSFVPPEKKNSLNLYGKKLNLKGKDIYSLCITIEKCFVLVWKLILCFLLILIDLLFFSGLNSQNKLSQEFFEDTTER
jgi:hypothetical protein